jgi:hypothetical protein
MIDDGFDIPLPLPLGDNYKHGQFARYGDDAFLPIRFSWQPKEDPKLSKERGRKIYTPALWLQIEIPSESGLRPLSVTERWATDEDKMRFRQSYEHFLRFNSSKPSVGTPLKMWPILDNVEVANLRALGLETVEQLAECNADSDIELMQFKIKAQAFLDLAAGRINVEDMKLEIEDQKAIIKDLSEQVKVLASEIEILRK